MTPGPPAVPPGWSGRDSCVLIVTMADFQAVGLDGKVPEPLLPAVRFLPCPSYECTVYSYLLPRNERT